MIKIIYITDQLYTHGGCEKILSQKLNYWANKVGYEVLLITSEQKKNSFCYPLSKKVQHIDLNINYIQGLSYFNFKNIVKFPEHYSQLKKVIKDFKPNAIFLISLSWIRFILPFLARNYSVYNEYHTSYYGFYLGYKKSSLITKIKKKISNIFLKFTENFYTNIIFLNKSELDFYNRKNGIIIPNFYDGSISCKKVNKKNQIISLGRLSSQKGYDMLIEAWAKIDNKINGWTFQIYGNGNDREDLLNKINTYNFKNEFQINYAISDVPNKLAESQFYVMSSRFETFPMVLLEALLQGLPVVSFDCPTGPRSILTENEDGVLAIPNDINDLADKMLLLINDEELRNRMSENARININRFTPDFVMNLWNELILKNSK